MTPDGRTLRDGMCDCAIHCPNRCEASHCPAGTPWCRCWCHADTYTRVRAEMATADIERSIELGGGAL